MIKTKLILLMLAFGLPHLTVNGQSGNIKVVKGVTAHRGYSSAYPENTLTAFKAGIAAGADWVELDIHKTSDGQIVVSHDPASGRAGDKNLVIANSTYQELRDVDVASAFRKAKGLTLEQCPVEHMPLLRHQYRRGHPDCEKEGL